MQNEKELKYVFAWLDLMVYKKKGLFQDFKKKISWYLKEQNPLLLPFLLFIIGLWYVSSIFLSRFIKNKSNKSIIAFTSLYYNGNSKAVYEFLNKFYPDKYVCYWVARNLKSFFDVKKICGRVVYVYFPFSFTTFLINTDFLITNDSYLTFLYDKDVKKIQLWHGVGPKGIPSDDYSLCNARCVTSEYTKKRHVDLWNAPPDKLYVTGFARMDILKKYLECSRVELFHQLGFKNEGRIILYAPTFDIGLWPWGEEYNEFEKFCIFCKKNDLILVLRFHPLVKINRWRVSDIIKKYRNVYWLDMSKEPDTMKILAVTDVLVTDWSSIYTDYFLTGRPIVYLEVDKKYYTEVRGEPEIPADFRAGEIAHSNDEFYESMKIVLNKGNRYRKQQENLLKIIHGSVDGNSSERVTKIIDKLL
ncbi:MAG: hypothetical protein BV456_09460 [Thermoplasmata archaeon M8B2D]|nr:MAG: hypothetical protein BV456_09460 [Thermoplasmata archaeon M8B2D]